MEVTDANKNDLKIKLLLEKDIRIYKNLIYYEFTS